MGGELCGATNEELRNRLVCLFFIDNLLFQTDVSTTKGYVKTSTFNNVVEIDICGIVSDPGLKCCNLNTSSCNGNIPF